jgi:hypothetical protein
MKILEHPQVLRIRSHALLLGAPYLPHTMQLVKCNKKGLARILDTR